MSEININAEVKKQLAHLVRTSKGELIIDSKQEQAMLPETCLVLILNEESGSEQIADPAVRNRIRQRIKASLDMENGGITKFAYAQLYCRQVAEAAWRHRQHVQNSKQAPENLE